MLQLIPVTCNNPFNFRPQISSTDELKIIKEGTFHKLVIKNCKDDDSGKYRFEAAGRKSEAVLTVEGKVLYLLYF